MELKLAGADFTFPLLPHERTFDIIAMLGFQGIFAASGRCRLSFELIDAPFPHKRLRHDRIEIVILRLPAERTADFRRCGDNRRRISGPARRQNDLEVYA